MYMCMWVSKKGSAMARHSKHRQAPWKHGHLAEKHGMRYGTNEADNSLNNYIFPLVCYHSDEEMGSASGAVNASPPSDSGVLSPSLTGRAKREFIMMPPEEKLRHFESRAQAHEDSQEFDACIQDLVRCVALSKLIYGEGHLKLAQAHARLAKAYFQLKGWGLQAQEHSARARELLPFCSSSCSGKKLEVLICLLSIHLTQGEAESSFLEAEQVVEDLHRHDGINQEEKIKTELEISTGLSRVYKKQSRPEEALSQCEKSLKLLKECDKPEKICSIYRDMAVIEQDRGHLDRAIEHLSKARSRCVEIQRASLAAKRSTFGDLSAEVADTLQLIGSVEMTEGQMRQAHRTMTKCLEIQSVLYGPQHKKTKATQKAVDMLARAPEVAERRQRQDTVWYTKFQVAHSQYSKRAHKKQ
ncbi:hypothetical protein L3Q82_007278 [Scortum barcoo]|uniref:Uncharacterized protein n=1 Tax=Scortum barcoo TaxID=214431 RepID=A0ACB8WT12_9TELE|nr:hypothetical protein L3Q82_007278 [Scortum barcoo]